MFGTDTDAGLACLVLAPAEVDVEVESLTGPDIPAAVSGLFLDLRVRALGCDVGWAVRSGISGIGRGL